MSKTLKKILIIISIVIVSLLLLGFILYKIFVTPEIKVMLSLVNAKKDITESLDFYINDDEKSILDYALKKSGTSSYDLTLTDSPAFEGVSASLVTKGNKAESVSQLSFNRFLSFDIYAGKNETLINLPIGNTGISIPKETKKEDWKNSAFYDTIPHNNQPDFIKFILNNNIDAKNFINFSKPQLIDIIKTTDVHKKDSEKVKIGDTKKKAEVFSINLSKENMNDLADIFESYLKKQNIKMPDYIRPALVDFAENNTILLKIRNFNIYEAEIINKNNDSHILTFTGGANQFDEISYFKNDSEKFSRIRTEKNETTKDVLYVKDKNIVTLERDKARSSVVFEYNETAISITGTGMTLTDNKLSYDNLKIKIGNVFEVSGSYSLEKRTSSSSIHFDKKKEYIDATILTKEKLDSIVSSFTGFFDKIPFLR